MKSREETGVKPMINPRCGNCIRWEKYINPEWGYCRKYDDDTPEISVCPRWLQNSEKENKE